MPEVYDEIQSALDDHLDTAGLSLRISWENVKFDPKGNEYLRPTFLPSGVVVERVGNGDTDQYDGLYQVDVFYPAGGGSGPARRKADEVVDRFKRGQRLIVSGVTVIIRNVERDPARQETDWYHIPVMVTWQSFVSN